MWLQEWGAGEPVVALHPLALESTAFFGVARRLARHGVRTIAVDLPGFGRSPAPDAPLTPALLAEPVIELARRLERRPVLLGMSMGGRVALEAALAEPDAFRGVVLVAPYLPWRRRRWMLAYAEWIRPAALERVPLERIWPLLQRIATFVESRPSLEHDWLARASARVAYYLSCPATRVHLVSAAREMALDPAFGARGTWTRLRDLALPAAFVWAGRDALIPAGHASAAAKLLPDARHVTVPCSGHFVNGRHHRCFEGAMADAARRLLAASAPARRRGRSRAARRGEFELARCVAEGAPRERAAARPAFRT